MNKKYFRKFGHAWLVTGVFLMICYLFLGTILTSVLWPGRIMTLFFTSLIFVLGPFVAGFLGFDRFFAWILSWEILVILNGILDKYILGAGNNGGEYLGPIMLFALPLFLLIGIVAEIRYKWKSRNISISG